MDTNTMDGWTFGFKMEEERNKASKKLHDLLSVIHQDQGQYTDLYGVEKSLSDAIIKVKNIQTTQFKLNNIE